jgi:hypothetical protein
MVITPAMLDWLRTLQDDGAAQARAVGEWRILLPAFTDVTVRDRLVVGSRTFEVERVEGESNETVRACTCSEVT